MGQKPVSRRDFLAPWRRPAPAPAPALQRLPVAPPFLPAPATPRAPTDAAAKAILRPPGAAPEARFLDACHRCARCVEACPHQAISLLVEGPGAGTPHVDTRTSPCKLCEGLLCTRACPSGALAPLDEVRSVFMGTAVIDEGQCLAYRGAPCRVCVEVCPVSGVLQLARGQRVYVPVAGAEACVGCGVCHRHCPSAEAIHIVPPDAAGPGPVRFEAPAPGPAAGPPPVSPSR